MKGITKNQVIILMSIFILALICINIDWRNDNARLQKTVDVHMQDMANLEDCLGQLQGSYDRKCSDIAKLENKVKELEEQAK